jgi:sirohydrochlorin ferrochelatase
VERTSVLILGHGSRRPRANQEFEELVAAFRRRRPGLDVGHAYIELADPLLGEGLAQLASRSDRVMILPLFLFAAGHVKDDVPEAMAAARERFPRVRFEATPALGVEEATVGLALERAGAALAASGLSAADTALVAVGRGSSDPEANGDFCKLVRMAGERGGFARAVPSFIAITGPRFEPAAEETAGVHGGPLLVLPYFLFEGLLVEQLAGEVDGLRRRHPGRSVALARHLGPAPRLLDLLEARLDAALASPAPAGAPDAAPPRRAAANG